MAHFDYFKGFTCTIVSLMSLMLMGMMSLLLKIQEQVNSNNQISNSKQANKFHIVQDVMGKETEMASKGQHDIKRSLFTQKNVHAGL